VPQPAAPETTASAVPATAPTAVTRAQFPIGGILLPVERSHAELPPHVDRPFEVYINGVPQVEGEDFDVVGRTLVFERQFAEEGKLGFWRWAALFLGVAGTYRKHDSVDVVCTVNGRRVVSNLKPVVARTLVSD
jgi:hypothetical protein